MSHNLPNTILRSGSYVFNRRVPKAVQADFGAEVVRVKLGRDQEQASLLAQRLTEKLDQIWSSPCVRPVDVKHLLSTIAPKAVTLSEAVDRYLEHRGANRGPGFEKVVRIAERALVRIAGNKDVKLYDREDARAFLRQLSDGGAKTGTLRRRLNTVKAVFEHAYAEDEVNRRNPFARLSIAGEGTDAKKRGTFTQEQLQQAYSEALASGSEIKLIVPILGETGARLAEIVGLRLCDVRMHEEAISIAPHAARRLKTRGSEREVPLIGAALEAMQLLTGMRREADEFLLPRYLRDGLVLATHASNAVNKWLRRDCGGLTCHCLRHTLRDRLRAVEAPMDLIDQIGGWSSVGGIGTSYGRGYTLGHKAEWLSRIAVPLGSDPASKQIAPAERRAA